MKTILFMVAAAILSFFGMTNEHSSLKTTGHSGVKSLCDDDPIVMHSHVHTISGTGISGAALALRKVGTSTPQYTGTTDSNGDFTFDAVAPGSYQYKISATGYYDKIVTLALTANADRTDTFILK